MFNEIYYYVTKKNIFNAIFFTLLSAADELICDKTNENCVKETDMLYYLPDYASVLLLNTLSTSANVLQTQVANHNCEQDSCTADICKELQQQLLHNKCAA